MLQLRGALLRSLLQRYLNGIKLDVAVFKLTQSTPQRKVRPDTRQDFGRADRFRNIVVSASLQGFQLVLFRILRTEKDHGNGTCRLCSLRRLHTS